MIGKLTGAMGRRGILRGAMGLGAAVGLGGKVSHGHPIGGAELMPMGPTLGGPGFQGPINPTRQDNPEPPNWLKELDREGDELREREFTRVRIDTLDIDLAALRGPSPAWKLVQQKGRDKARREAAKTLWQRIDDARRQWFRGLAR